jgi:hypothetical protein
MPNVFPTRFTLPLARESRFTSRINRTPDFTEIRAQDQTGPLFLWNLQLGPLTDADAATLQNFYAACNGGYQSFAFLDPLDNLLQWSEDFTQACWQKTSPSSFGITSGGSDPLGGSGAQTLSNTTAAVNTVSQSLAVNPQGLTLTASVWLLGSGAPITLRVSDGGSQNFAATISPAGSWQRYTVTGTFAASGSEIVWAADLPANAGAEFFGAQLAAMPGPGAYTRTTTVSGFHPNCCFDSQSLAHRVIAPNQNQVTVSIMEHA